MLAATTRTLLPTPADERNALEMSRRQALGQLASGLGCAFGMPAVLRDVRADEPQSSAVNYKLRDIERVYELWKSQSKSNDLPPLEVFREAVTVCRDAACSIFLMKGSRMSASHSGFLVTVPEEFQTASSRGKLYVVTCDHARIDHAGARPIIQLSSGKNIQPQVELVAKLGQRGIPLKDLRIYECLASSFEGMQPLPLKSIDVSPPQDAPVMTYEPLNLRATQIVDEQRQTVVLDAASQSKPILEKFILTRVSNPLGFPYDSTYPETSGFNTAGQLKVGGSGSPVILFTKKDFAVAGHQVSYGHSHDTESEERIDGEIDNDGNVVHINNAINLLREKGRWK